jgi:hypothetical protein
MLFPAPGLFSGLSEEQQFGCLIKKADEDDFIHALRHVLSLLEGLRV